MITKNKFRVLTDGNESLYKFSFCKLCNFYECELVEEYMLFKKNNPEKDFPSYSPNDLANGCPMKKFVQIECGRKRVADGIGEAFKINIRHNSEIEIDTDKWEPNQPVFISAQTGQGKNYFIEKTLLPYTRELNRKKRSDQKVLIISNRIALRLQIENRLKSINNHDFEQNTIYSYGECADVISYQSLLNKVDELRRTQEKKTSSYIFVVCDEAHFFTSDAMFNPDTEKILYTIVNIFRDAIRIYMSATPYECLECINKYEGKDEAQPRMGVFYHFKRDYCYLDIKYYSKPDELKNIIINSVTKEDKKWLIFLDNIEKGEYFKTTLENCAGMEGKVFTVSAKSKYNKEYQNMVLTERLDRETSVLIATSVIDNGVNFRDIDNIVISDISKVKCLQMVGRGRVGSKNDKITLYIKRFNGKYMENTIDYLRKQQDAYHDYDLAYNRALDDSEKIRKYNYELEFLNKYYNAKPEDWKNAKHWFGRDKDIPTKLYPNEIAKSLVDKLVLRYEYILEEMRRTDEGQKVTGQRYLEYQLSWFGKKYDEENDITLAGTNKAKKVLITFLESHAMNETQIFDNEDNAQDNFRKEFTKLHDKAFPRQDKNKEREYGFNKINKILEEYTMNYKLGTDRETSGDKKTYWKIVKLNRECDKSKS